MSETVTITMRRIDYGISWGIRFASEKPMMTIVGESAFEDGARVNDLVKKVNDRDIPATIQGIDMLRALASAGLTVTLVVERPRGTDANVVQTYSQAGLPTLPKQPIQQTCRSEENTLPVSVTSGASSLASTNVSTLGGVMSQAKPVAESDNTKRVSQFGRLNVVAAETNQECKPQMAPWAAIRLRRTIADQQPLWMMEDSYNANENNRQLAFAAVKTDSDNANSNTSQLPSPTPPSTTIPTLTRTRTPTPTPTDTVTVTATPPPPDCSKGLEDSLQQPGIGEYFCEQSFHKPPIELPKPTMPAMPAPTLSMNHDAGRTLDRDFRNSSLTRRSSVTRPISSPPVPSSSGYATTSTARSVSFGVEQSQQRCSPPAGSDFALLPSEKVQEMHPMQANWSTLTPRTRPSNPPPKLVQPVRKDSTLAPPNTPPPNFRKSTPPLSAPPLSAPPLASRASLLSAATSLRCFASKIMKSEKSELIKPTRSKTTNLTSTMKASTLGVKPSIAPPKRPPPQATVLLQRSRSIESFRDDYLNGFMNPYCAE